MATQKKFYNSQGEEVQRTPCEIYTRVMGYYRPVSQFNNWKKSEHYSRKHFEEKVCMDQIENMNKNTQDNKAPLWEIFSAWLKVKTV